MTLGELRRLLAQIPLEYDDADVGVYEGGSEGITIHWGKIVPLKGWEREWFIVTSGVGEHEGFDGK